MVRSIDIQGQEPFIIIGIDGIEQKRFDRSGAITAQNLYAAFDYHAGDRYAITQENANDVPSHTFEPFAAMIREIVNELNKIECLLQSASDESSSSAESNLDDSPLPSS